MLSTIQFVSVSISIYPNLLFRHKNIVDFPIENENTKPIEKLIGAFHKTENVKPIQSGQVLTRIFPRKSNK